MYDLAIHVEESPKQASRRKMQINTTYYTNVCNNIFMPILIIIIDRHADIICLISVYQK